MEIGLVVIFGLGFWLALGAIWLIFSKPREKVDKEVLLRWRVSREKVKVLLAEVDLDKQKQALVEADKLLDNILRTKVKGKDMGTRLKMAKGYFDFSLYQQLWQAHKLRNRIVHEVGVEVKKKELSRAGEILLKGCKILGL